MDEVYEDEDASSEADGHIHTVNVFEDEPEVPTEDVQALDRLDEVAREVLNGEWGIGQERRIKLVEAGLDPVEVQRQIVRIVNQTP